MSNVNTDIERRIIADVNSANIEVRSADSGLATLIGYAAIFNSITHLDWYDEEILPGAFAQSLANGDDVRALVNHDSSKVIGRRNAQTLRLAEDATGLRVEIDLPDNTAGRDLLVSIEREDIDGMSFGFRADVQKWIESEGANDLRQLERVTLIEVSPVTFPAYPDTTIAKRSRDAQFGHHPKHRPSTAKPSINLLRLRRYKF